MPEDAIQIFIFGLGKAGKTTMVEYFREGRFIPQAPTIGVSINRLVFSKLVLEFTDVGGQEAYRKEWVNYLKRPHVLVFVLDASDRDPSRIELASKELFRILRHPKAVGVPLLFVANKIDLPLVMPKKVIIEKIGLNEIKDRQVAVYEASAKTGENMDAVLNAMTSMVLKDDAIEHFLNKEIQERARSLLSQFRALCKKGDLAYKKKNLEEALANLNLAKEIASNLFQLGVISDGKTYQKIGTLSAKIERELALSQSKPPEEIEPSRFTPRPVTIKITPDDSKQPRIPFLKEREAVPTAEPPKASRAKTVSLFLFGLDKTGKEAFTDFLLKERYIKHSTQMEIDLSKIVLENVSFKINQFSNDVEDGFEFWRHVDLMVYIIDCSDAGNYQEAKKALWAVLSKSEAITKPLLILINKFDHPGAKPKDFIENVLDIKRIPNKEVGVYETSIEQNYRLKEPMNFVVSVLMKDSTIDKIVKKEMNKMIKNFQEIYDAYIKEAKIMEKNKDFESAFNRVYKAKLIQEELFKYNMNKAQKQIKKCEEWMAKLRKKL
ncbi:MAG: ADP-ribosylation factor-like protein [Promethearchaeota archaeon]